MSRFLDSFIAQKISPMADGKVYTRLELLNRVKSWNWPEAKKQAFIDRFVFLEEEVKSDEHGAILAANGPVDKAYA